MGNIDETTKFIRRSLSFPARVNDPPNTGSLVLPNAVIVFPYTGSRLSLADHPPSTLPTRNAVALGEPVDPSLSDPPTIAMAFLVIRGHATAHHLGRVLVGTDGDTMELLSLRGRGAVPTCSSSGLR